MDYLMFKAFAFEFKEIVDGVVFAFNSAVATEYSPWGEHLLGPTLERDRKIKLARDNIVSQTSSIGFDTREFVGQFLTIMSDYHITNMDAKTRDELFVLVAHKYGDKNANDFVGKFCNINSQNFAEPVFFDSAKRRETSIVENVNHEHGRAKSRAKTQLKH